MKKLPIGIQSFESLRNGDYLYVDKTRLAYNLAHDGKYFFLSRPRRFGKSLLLSTLKAYFEGRKDLFEGLTIMELEHDWKQHPVLHLDLNTGDYTSFADGDIRSYWYQSGTPTFLIKRMENNHIEIPDLSEGKLMANSLADTDSVGDNWLALFFQTGYLTIKGYNKITQSYRLGFPNREVEEGFVKSLIPRKLFKVAVSFNTQKRNIDEWQIKN